MPSQDTWSAQSALKQPAYSGRQRSWVVTPGFGSLPKDSKPVNPYNDTQKRVTQMPYTQYRVPKSGGSPVYLYNNVYLSTSDALNDGVVAWFSNPAIATWPSDIAGMENATVLKAYGKVADAKVNVAVAYAEASKTSDLILDTARRVDKAYRAFRKGNLKEIARQLNITPKRLHKSWLEYKYGWMPLLMDVKGAAEFFAQQHIERSTRFKVTARERVTKTYNYVEARPSYGGGATHPGTYFLSGDKEVTVKLWCELSSPHLSALQQLGLTNPALVAWELVPFSFVFDWFIQVGDYLTGLTALQGVNVRRTLISSTTSLGGTMNAPAVVRSDSSWNYYTEPSGLSGSRRTYTRDRYIPSPYELHPPVKTEFGFTKLVTSLALLQGTYRGNSRTSRI